MSTSTIIGTNRDPHWARVPPHVPTYPNPPAYFRQTEADHYTRPVGKSSYQRLSDKWHRESPEWRDEFYRSDSRTPVMRFKEFQPGVTKPAYQASWEKPACRAEYLRQGGTQSETVRANGIYKVHQSLKDKNLYQFSNHMTGTQYQKPVTGLYGPMLKEKVYGLPSQHNRHGFMNFNDYYF